MKPEATSYRLIYRSRPTPNVATNITVEVDRINETSLYLNYSSGVTGLLLLAKGYFIQALEGSANDVRSTYGRISLDRRHYDLHVISQGFVDQRLFGEWAMCAGNLSSADSLIVNRLWSRKSFLPETMTGAAAEQLLVAVADFQKRTRSQVLL